MTRRCSHCSTNGHNSRTCPNRGVKLFGVRITDGSIRKCASMGNLTHYTGSTSGGGAGGYNHLNGGGAVENLDSPGAGGDNNDHGVDVADGYASEDFVPGSSSSRERKKGVPWTEEEHKMFLVGLQKLGKGDWRGIARKYVISRTPTQVASHAQKYFIRQSNSSRRKRRSSLFDMVADDSAETPMPSHEVHVVNPSHAETSNNNNNNNNNNNDNNNDNNNNIKDNNTLLAINTFEEESESMESTVPEDPPQPIPTPNPVASVAPQFCYPVVFPTYMPPFIPVAVPYWPGCNMKPFQVESHQVLKPTAVHSKNPIPVDGLMSMSKLSLAEPVQNGEPIPRTLNLVGGLGRQSAFHAKSSAGSPSHSPIHAV